MLGPFGSIKQPVLTILQTQISTTVPQTDIISTNKQLINAVSQSSYRCAQTSEINLFHVYTTIRFLGKHVIQTNPSKIDERLFSDIYLCRLRLKQGREIQDFIF